MKYLKGKEEKKAIKYLKAAGEVARKSTCQRAKCGTVIVANDTMIGSGFNSPVANLESQRRCLHNKDSYHKKVTNKTCCVHAEQRAIMDALKYYPTKLAGSTLYFMRLDDKNNLTKAGKPYCTICSNMALDVGIKYFVLWHEDGVCIYNTKEYNTISYEYQE